MSPSPPKGWYEKASLWWISFLMYSWYVIWTWMDLGGEEGTPTLPASPSSPPASSSSPSTTARRSFHVPHYLVHGKRVSDVSGKWMSSAGQAPKRTSTARKAATSTLDLVREGVRRFILHDASIGDFRKTIRDAARKGELSPPSLTGTAFRRIVKQAIAERKRKAVKSPHE